MTPSSNSYSEGGAIAIGCVGGLFAGAGLGGCIAWLLDSAMISVSMITIVHTILAMVMMGAWTAPTLLSREE